MKKYGKYISFKTLLSGSIVFICIFLYGIVVFLQSHMMRSLTDQEMATRWSAEGTSAQISAFFAQGEVEDETYFKGVGVSIEEALKAASLTGKEGKKDEANKHDEDKENIGNYRDNGDEDKENTNTNQEESQQRTGTIRLWMDAVSRQGEVVLKKDNKTAEVNVYGVEGDFFQFHPLYLLGGTYFSPMNQMKDGVILDKETAWQLFGSNDVEGMEITISDIPHVVVGVYEKPEGRIEKAAGLDGQMCFISLESLNKYGMNQGGYNYEVVLPDPIKDFGISTMKNVLSSEGRSVSIVDNSARYQLLSLLNILLSFGTRSMSHNNIIYPYWENIARGYEDIFALLLLFKTILLVIPLIIIVPFIFRWYKNKSWSISGVIQWLKDKHYELGTIRMEKIRQKKLKLENTGEDKESEAKESGAKESEEKKGEDN